MKTGVPVELRDHPSFCSIPTEAITGDDRVCLTDQRLKVLTDTYLQLRQQPGLGKTALKDLTSRFGIHGRADIVTHLGHYISPTTLFIIPLVHAGLLGVLKQFLALALGKEPAGAPSPPWSVSKASREKFIRRCGEVSNIR